eukprot:scaffold27918_cov38-Prasinocladus_malaysianus.AAC.1
MPVAAPKVLTLFVFRYAVKSLCVFGEQHFIKYYDQVMPLLFEIMMHAKERTMLRAKCLECISLVGMAVGRDRSREDAKRMMSIITQWQQDTEDPTFCYTLQAGARLCKCLGEEFMPYLDAVMPPLVQAAGDENYFEVRHRAQSNIKQPIPPVVPPSAGEHCVDRRRAEVPHAKGANKGLLWSQVDVKLIATSKDDCLIIYSPLTHVGRSFDSVDLSG